jgi:hypothetical protein
MNEKKAGYIVHLQIDLALEMFKDNPNDLITYVTVARHLGDNFIASTEEIATAIGRSSRTVRLFLKRCEAKALTINRRASENGASLASEYILNPEVIYVSVSGNE